VANIVRISSKGQLVIPSRLRVKLNLKAGTKVNVEERDGRITITPNPPDSYDAMIALRGVMSHIEEDVEAWWTDEKHKEREREDRQ